MPTLTLVSSFSRNDPLNRPIEAWAARIEEITEGELRIDVRAAGELVGAFEVTDAVLSGVAQIGWTSPAFTGAYATQWQGLSVPGQLSLGPDTSEALWRTATDALAPPAGLETLAMSVTGASILSTTDPLTSFEGLKLRATGQGANVLDRLGVAPQSVAGAELYAALLTGVLDGTVSSAFLTQAAQVDDVATAFTALPGNRLYDAVPLALSISTDALTRLSPELRDLLRTESGAALSRSIGAQIESAEASDRPPGLETLSGDLLAAYEAAVAAHLDGLDPGAQSTFTFLQDILNAAAGPGPGNDSILGTDGADTLEGLAGNDILRGGAGNDSLDGDAGDDSLFGNSGNDTLRGDDGNDRLSGSTGDDSLRGGAGNDTLYGSAGEDILRGDAGQNQLFGGADADKLYGGADNDLLDGASGNDLLVGGGGNDTALADNGDDTLYGNSGDDTLNGEAGNDWASGGSGNDIVLGRAGEDTMRGSSGNDRLYGGADDDVLAGNAGNDQLYGGSNDDRLFGGAGADTLIGNNGTDLLNGGSGADVFVFDSASDSPHGGARDTIADFTTGIDRIDLSGFSGTLTFSGATYSGAGNEVRYNETVGRLYVDLDGDRASDFSVNLEGAPGLVADDLIL